MRKLLLLIGLAAPLVAQVSNPSIISVTSAPSGACTAGLPNQQVTTTGVQYSCQSGTWGPFGTGAAYTLPIATTSVLGGIKPDGTSIIVNGTTGVASIVNSVVGNIPSGLIGWYPLTEATGTAPVDISGSGNNATLPGSTSNPTGTPQGLAFSGTTAQWFSLPAAVSSAGTTYMAYLCQTPPTGSGTNWTNPAFMEAASAGGPILTFFGFATSRKSDWSMGMGSTAAFSTSRSTDFVNGCHVYTWILGTNPTKDRMFVDQTEVSYAAQGSSGGFVGTGGLLQVGGSSIVGSTHFLGTLRNLFVWNRNLNTVEVQSFTLAATELAKQAGAINPTPNYTSVSTVQCGVDSITAGQGVTNPYCGSVLFVPTETVTRFNLGIGGQSMAGFVGYGPQMYIPNIALNAPHNTLVIMGCTNDVTGSETAVTCFGTIKAAALKAKSYGLKIIVFPILSFASNDAFKDSLDTLLNAGWQTFADAYISPTDVNLWADGASANATYFQDGLHPTQTGQNLLGGYLTNAYNKLYGSSQTSWNTTAAATYTIAAADSYLTVTANSTLTLPSCKGYSGAFTVKVNPTLVVTLKSAAAAETIDGTDYSSVGLTLAAGTTNAVTVVPAAPATATCTWIKSL